jgi:RHS repeat-associated protein
VLRCVKKVTRVESGVTTVEDYAYNALGALKVNAGVTLDDQRPKLAGGGTADAAVPATVGGQPIVLDAGGRVTSLRGTTFKWVQDGTLREVNEPIPAVAETYRVDARGRRYSRSLGGAVQEYYAYEGLDRIAIVGPNGPGGAGPVLESYLFDGIDHPLRIKIASSSTTAYYELDLAGNVRGLRASGGASLGQYRYSAFGQTLEDTTSITQPLRWKGRWFSPVAGGTYDVRARQWSPELGAFLSVDEYEFHDKRATLWGWPRQNPIRFRDPMGHKEANPEGEKCDLPPPPKSEQERCQTACDKEHAKQLATCGTNRQPKGGDEYSPQDPNGNPCEEVANAAQNDCYLRCQGRDPNNTPRPIPPPNDTPQPNDHPVFASGG